MDFVGEKIFFERMNVFHSMHKVVSILFLLLIIVLVFLRENLFLEINAILDGYAYNKAYFYFLNEELASMDKGDLINLKWILTLVFIALISGLTVGIIKLWFARKEFTRWVLYAFSTLIVLIGVIFLIIKFFGVFDDYYFILRKMIGFLNSPIPLFLFFVLFYYIEEKKAK